MTSISVRGLTKCYGRKNVLRELDLSVAAGSIYGLLGRNGAGKTTLMQILMGLTPADAGEAVVLGRRLSGAEPDAKDAVAYVAQGEFLPPAAKIADLTLLESELRTRWDSTLLSRWLDDEGIAVGRKVSTLSGGQRKRLELELVLASEPKVLLFDEPLAGLDPVVRASFVERLVGSVADQEVTALLSSHLVTDLERLCDRIGILARGAIRFESSVDQLKTESGGSLEDVVVTRMKALDEEAP